MKKLLSSLMATTIVASSASTVVSCGSYKAFNEIYLVTDAGKVSDKSFNESGKLAGDTFLREFLGKTEYNGIGYNQPKSVPEIPDGYPIAKNAGAKNLILPGFHHGGANLKAASTNMGESGTVVIIDNNHYRTEFNQDGSVIADSNKPVDNVIGLLYRADISGFWAGMSAIIESIIIGNTKKEQEVITSTIKAPTEKKTVVRMSTFGGMSNFTAVETFMVGYLAAIEVYNQIFNTENYETIKTTLTNEINEKLLKDSDKKYEELSKDVWASRVESQKTAPTSSNDTNWYSLNFDLGGANKTGIASTLVGNSDVIMPVAGPQTQDILGERRAQKKSLKLVGVDTNQADSFTSYGKDIFLTSAEKNIVDSTIMALAHTTQYSQNEEVQTKAQEYYKEKNLNMTFDDTGLEQQANTPVGKEVYKKDENGNITGDQLKDWNKTTIWSGGQISSSSNNLVSNELKEIIQETFKQDTIMINASIEYFKYSHGTKATELFTYTEDYVNTILKNLK